MVKGQYQKSALLFKEKKMNYDYLQNQIDNSLAIIAETNDELADKLQKQYLNSLENAKTLANMKLVVKQTANGLVNMVYSGNYR